MRVVEVLAVEPQHGEREDELQEARDGVADEDGERGGGLEDGHFCVILGDFVLVARGVDVIASKVVVRGRK